MKNKKWRDSGKEKPETGQPVLIEINTEYGVLFGVAQFDGPDGWYAYHDTYDASVDLLPIEPPDRWAPLHAVLDIDEAKIPGQLLFDFGIEG